MHPDQVLLWSYTYIEVVLHVLSGRNRALGDRAGTVHNGSAILAESMPVDASRLVAQSVINVDNQSVTDLHINLGAGPLIVDTDHRSLKSVGGGIDPSDVPIEVDVLGCCQFGGQASQEKQIKLAH